MTRAGLPAAGQPGRHARAGMVSRAAQVRRAVTGRAFGPRHELAAGGNLALAALAALNALAGDQFGPDLASGSGRGRARWPRRG